MKYDPVNRCIYCGATDRLQDEHIIPLGLHGNWLLPKASCNRCATITGAVEQLVLRGPLWLPRVALGFRSRSKARPKTFPLIVRAGGIESKLDVPVDKNLPSIVLPLFDAPGEVRQAPIEDGIRVNGFYVGHVLRAPNEVRAELNAESVALEFEYPVVEFARMVAKIALGHAVARLGVDRVIDPLVTPAILGTASDVGHWVGALPNVLPPPASDTLHIAQVHSQNDFVAVRLSLFAQQPAPVYYVLISRGKR